MDVLVLIPANPENNHEYLLPSISFHLAGKIYFAVILWKSMKTLVSISLLCNCYISWHLWGDVDVFPEFQSKWRKLRVAFLFWLQVGWKSGDICTHFLETNITCFSFFHFCAWYRSDLEFAKWTKTTALEVFLANKIGIIFFDFSWFIMGSDYTLH